MSLSATGKLIVSFSTSTLPPRADRAEWRKTGQKQLLLMQHLCFYVTEDVEKVIASIPVLNTKDYFATVIETQNTYTMPQVKDRRQ